MLGVMQLPAASFILFLLLDNDNGGAGFFANEPDTYVWGKGCVTSLPLILPFVASYSFELACLPSLTCAPGLWDLLLQPNLCL